MRTMAGKSPTLRQIKSLVGGKPLAHVFHPEDGSLVVIGPNGKKFRFSKKDWFKSTDAETKEAEDPNTPKKKASKSKKAD
jgi:hypothetical protein